MGRERRGIDITGDGWQIISYVRPTDHKDFGLLVCSLLLLIKATMHGRVFHVGV